MNKKETGDIPTVIRSKTLMPTKDFKEWAKRIREVNPNAIVIPCDAEVVSAEAVQGKWIIRGEPPWLVRECSECGTKWHHWSGGTSPNYCGNCGARMKPYKGGDSE